jgi:hypothetical protein
MLKIVKRCFFVFTGVAIVGCASTAANLQKETARSIGGNVTPEQVNILSIDRGVIDVKWKASAPAGNYDCSADDMVRHVDCTKK